MAILFRKNEGPLLRWQENTFVIDDLNTKQKIIWLMGRWELFKLGFWCMITAIFA